MARLADGWIRFRDSQVEYELDYPRVASSGATVRADLERNGERTRLRLSTADGREVYLHLDRTPPRTPAEGRRMLEQDVGGRFADASFGGWEDALVDGRPVLACTFRFADRVRRAYFLAGSPDGLASYRVILDPRSSINERILATMRRRAG